MIEILPLIITLGILVFGILFLIKKRIDNKKETGTYFSFSFKGVCSATLIKISPNKFF